MSAPSITMPDGNIRWDLPARGPVAMYSLIAAESAIFTIFVAVCLHLLHQAKALPDLSRRTSFIFPSSPLSVYYQAA